MSSDAEAARKIVLDCEARLNAAGADRTKVKYEIYKELKAQGLNEAAELLMTFDVVARANSENSIPQAVPDLQASAEHPVSPEPQPTHPHPKRSWKRHLAIAASLAFLILVGVWLWPYLYTLVVNHFSPVTVPNSHFVSQHGKNKKLIVFVHGVIGDMDNTWLNPATHSSWPELITGDQDLEQFDVFVYGYGSPAMGNASSINQISNRFLQQLKDFGFFNNYSEIDFITHSMGGIITKRTLDMLNTPSDSPLLQRVHTVIYISVPSNGADLAALASWISQNPQFKGMDPKSASDFLQSVEGDWANLLRQRTVELPFPKTYTAYETIPTGPVKVVPQLYTSELSDGRVLGFDYNHIDIVKPKDRNAEVYLWTKARLLENLAERHTTVDRRPSADRVKFDVSGSFDLGYKIVPGSWLIIDVRTGTQISANITVVGPDGKMDVFSNQAVYQTPTTWGWQRQGSSGGSLDFTDQDPFVRYPGGVLSHSAYDTPSLGHIITSSNTTLKPVADSDSSH